MRRPASVVRRCFTLCGIVADPATSNRRRTADETLLTF
jgi:uncharacterized membrane protein